MKLLKKILLLIFFIAVCAILIKYFYKPDSGLNEEKKIYQTVKKGNLKISIISEGEIKPKNAIDIISEVKGQATIISIVPEGSKVKKGDFLFELESREIEERFSQEKVNYENNSAMLIQSEKDIDLQKNQNESDLKKAELDIELKKMELDKYLKGEHPKTLRGLELNISQCKTKLKQSEENVTHTEKLMKRGFLTKKDFENAELEFETAKNNLETANSDYDLYLKYTHTKNLKVYNTNMSEAEKNLERTKKRNESMLEQKKSAFKSRGSQCQMLKSRMDLLEEQLTKTKVYAPSDGIVVYKSDEYRKDTIRAGSAIYHRQAVIILPDMSQLQTNTKIHEYDIGKIKKNMDCIITLDALQGESFKGRIAKIGVLADAASSWFQPDVKVFDVEIEILDKTESLKPGLSAKIDIFIDTLLNVNYIPAQSVLSENNKHYCYVKYGEKNLKKEIKIGKANNSFVSVLSGVETGEEVLISAFGSDDNNKVSESNSSPSDSTAKKLPIKSK